MVLLRIVGPDDPRLRSMVDSAWKNLSHNGWLMCYSEDTTASGKPTGLILTLCMFWLIEVLATLGRTVRVCELDVHRRGVSCSRRSDSCQKISTPPPG